jgi:guanylate kinase
MIPIELITQEMDMSNESLSFDLFHPQPLMIVISGPSGVGKDAVIKEMQKRNLPMHFVVTMTNRLPRPNEEHGKDYIFVSTERFKELIEQDAFLESALVYDDYKGIPKDQIRQAMDSKLDVILRVDVQGAKTLRRLAPEAILIFLIPTNEREWLERLRSRSTETEENLALRLETAKEELQYLNEFDYVVVNTQDQLEETVNTIVSIIKAEHHRVVPRKVTL